MKAIKNLCLFCFLIFGILMQSEIFQDQLWNFSTAYFTSSRYEVASEDMSQFLKDVSETATENDVHIFSQYNEINNKYLSTLHIYGDDKVIRQTLKNTANIEESEYTALVSGITKVKFQHPAAMRRYDVHDAMREKYDRCPDTALRSARSHATKRGSPLQNGLPRTYRATAAISSRSTHRR